MSGTRGYSPVGKLVYPLALQKGVAAAWNADDYLAKENGRVHAVSF